MRGFVVKRLLYLLLLIGAVVGLVGQGTAVASARPCPEMIALQAAKDEACAMMAMPKKHRAPGAKHVSLGCAAMLGCMAPTMIEPALFITSCPSIEPLAAVWPSPHSSIGRSVAPALEPPASPL